AAETVIHRHRVAAAAAVYGQASQSGERRIHHDDVVDEQPDAAALLAGGDQQSVRIDHGGRIERDDRAERRRGGVIDLHRLQVEEEVLAVGVVAERAGRSAAAADDSERVPGNRGVRTAQVQGAGDGRAAGDGQAIELARAAAVNPGK